MRLISCLKPNTQFISKRFRADFSNLKPPWDVLFFGTDNFSLASLQALNKTYLRRDGVVNRLEVVTTVRNNLIRKFSEKNELVVHNWPLVEEPGKLGFHIGLVVSFGHLIPRDVIELFPMGMLNVHASLLPRWRGAAPIIYAIANGDTTTGVSIMRIRPGKFDIGEIIGQQEIAIGADTKMPELYDKLAELGADKLVSTLESLPGALARARPQEETGVTHAPRINSSIANVDFTQLTAQEVYNLSRALTGVFPLSTTWNNTIVKIHNVAGYVADATGSPGFVAYDRTNKVVKIFCKDGCVLVDKIGVLNKKVMNATEFNNGFITKQPLDHRIFC